ncbi:hypothetical protein SAMN05216326_13155 [Nitrosomonas marina]|uniref:Uncharacterized protein n=1 Tax=Nitrosomonas marina TaxID=917 RepID=A0A1I0EYP2_9PROT|nr:hypothetical protein [Nitrosomonas marina]SET50788.1 hypothetical protein SAMN05216326_13155 [Nitrosomonas marina]
MAKKRTAYLLFLLLISACAINNHGFVKSRYFENDNSFLVTQESWGGFISTQFTDRGLVLGYTKRMKIYPKLERKNILSIKKFLQQINDNNFVEISKDEISFEKKKPYAWIEKNQGIVVHANSLKTGLSAGIESRSILRIPPDFDGAFLITRDHMGSIKASIQSSIQQH